jgi:hypothetical protein
LLFAGFDEAIELLGRLEMGLPPKQLRPRGTRAAAFWRDYLNKSPRARNLTAFYLNADFL